MMSTIVLIMMLDVPWCGLVFSCLHVTRIYLFLWFNRLNGTAKQLEILNARHSAGRVDLLIPKSKEEPWAVGYGLFHASFSSFVLFLCLASLVLLCLTSLLNCLNSCYWVLPHVELILWILKLKNVVLGWVEQLMSNSWMLHWKQILAQILDVNCILLLRWGQPMHQIVDSLVQNCV